ncbi:MAG: hypothetical protein WCG25_00620 [bacterium]
MEIVFVVSASITLKIHCLIGFVIGLLLSYVFKVLLASVLNIV